MEEAGAALEEARTLMLLRAEEALAAGASEESVSRAAGITRNRLRAWLSLKRADARALSLARPHR